MRRPGGDFAEGDMAAKIAQLQRDYPFLPPRHAQRLVRSYGLDAWDMLGDAKGLDGLGTDFGATLAQAEVRWLMTVEFARTADDVLWRRSKLGLRLTSDQAAELGTWMAAQSA